MYFQVILGKVVSREATLDQDIAQTILSCQTDHSFKTVLGGTMCTDDFYEGEVMFFYNDIRLFSATTFGIDSWPMQCHLTEFMTFCHYKIWHHMYYRCGKRS